MYFHIQIHITLQIQDDTAGQQGLEPGRNVFRSVFTRKKCKYKYKYIYHEKYKMIVLTNRIWITNINTTAIRNTTTLQLKVWNTFFSYLLEPVASCLWCWRWWCCSWQGGSTGSSAMNSSCIIQDFKKRKICFGRRWSKVSNIFG